MSDLEMTNEAKTEDFTDELSDEALDREGGEGRLTNLCGPGGCGASFP